MPISCSLLNWPSIASDTASIASSCVLPSFTKAELITAVVLVSSSIEALGSFNFTPISNAAAPTAFMSTLRKLSCILSTAPWNCCSSPSVIPSL